MKQCYYDPSLGDTEGVPSCHCGTIGLLSNDDFPDCGQLSNKSWMPLMLNIINWTLAGGTWLWGLWMISMLKKVRACKESRT